MIFHFYFFCCTVFNFVWTYIDIHWRSTFIFKLQTIGTRKTDTNAKGTFRLHEFSSKSHSLSFVPTPTQSTGNSFWIPRQVKNREKVTLTCRQRKKYQGTTSVVLSYDHKRRTRTNTSRVYILFKHTKLPTVS